MRYVSNAVLTINLLLLLAFSAVQWNDPDPILWIAFYLLCAAVPFLALINKPLKIVAVVALIACAIEMARTGAGAYNYYLHMTEEPLMQSMNPNKPYIEEAREFLGALIALVLVLISQWLAVSKAKNR
jgi:hypothetical protein